MKIIHIDPGLASQHSLIKAAWKR